MAPRSPLKGNSNLQFQKQSKRQVRNQDEQNKLVSSVLKMELKCFSEELGSLKRAIWCYIPEDGPVHNFRCEILKSYIT